MLVSIDPLREDYPEAKLGTARYLTSPEETAVDSTSALLTVSGERSSESTSDVSHL